MIMARGAVKTVLDIYPVAGENGVLVGKYGARLMLGNALLEIPSDFHPYLRVESLDGAVGSGEVTGTVQLMYGGTGAETGDIPEAYADLHGKAVHAVRVVGVGGMEIPMGVLLAVADSAVPLSLFSKETVGQTTPPVEDVPAPDPEPEPEPTPEPEPEDPGSLGAR